MQPLGETIHYIEVAAPKKQPPGEKDCTNTSLELENIQRRNVIRGPMLCWGSKSTVDKIIKTTAHAVIELSLHAKNVPLSPNQCVESTVRRIGKW